MNEAPKMIPNFDNPVRERQVATIMGSKCQVGPNKIGTKITEGPKETFQRVGFFFSGAPEKGTTFLGETHSDSSAGFKGVWRPRRCSEVYSR